MQSLTVTEYDHFISFSWQTDDGELTTIQYRSSQVWKDEDGIWQVRETPNKVGVGDGSAVEA